MSTWDVFISHASEDKEAFVQELAEGLRAAGLKVWFDKFTLHVGDSLRQSIDMGLSQSHYGVVVISPAFMRKPWPQNELNALLAREIHGHYLVLPVWHDVDLDMILQYSPVLGDRVATSSKRGINCVIADLLSAMRIEIPANVIGSIEALDHIERHMLMTLYTTFEHDGFRLTQIAEKTYISERFMQRFDGLIHRGYIDRFLDQHTQSRKFRLSPSLDVVRLQKLSSQPDNRYEA
jgi:hypothetical protein